MGGYHIEILTDPFTCFNAKNYGALIIADPEDYFSEAEIMKLRRDIETE
jgi:membrane-bound transcription factor site-1 protease